MRTQALQSVQSPSSPLSFPSPFVSTVLPVMSLLIARDRDCDQHSANPVDNSHEFSKHWCSFPTCRMHADSVRLEKLPTGTEPASPISGTSRNQPNAFSAQRGIIGQISTCFRRKRKVNFSEQCTATKVLKRGTKKERCFRFSNWVGEPSSFMARVGREGREV